MENVFVKRSGHSNISYNECLSGINYPQLVIHTAHVYSVPFLQHVQSLLSGSQPLLYSIPKQFHEMSYCWSHFIDGELKLADGDLPKDREWGTN